ncbi:zinc finger BED domain-containing protein RICESLEEPER 2-like [Solanum stenotomum]|uniref:zinc finger BED domain-containing protein RICESLEEPER 2-like n=1 Tax=Solanum stenotomum TaxID=172797 RepID=UPI0020D07B89|nr:zinc finger BED domain-containing protein RICESLEEPER 2-like [Solanum stenotomum]
MAACITNCLLEWGLDNVFTITVDNASSNDVTVKEMSKQLSNWGTNIMDGDHLHVRCMAHILNLIVQDGLKEIGKSVKLVRQAVKYIKQSPARLRKFKECCESQLITCKKSLCLDVPTRWNSTYSMLDVAQHFEFSFERYSFYDIGYLNHFRTFGSVSSEDENGTSDVDGTSANIITSDILTSADWKNVRSMVKFLETFYVLTLKVSGSNYVTSNTHFVEIAELNLILKEMMENEDGNLKEMAKSMNEKFKKYWGEPHKMNNMIFISSVLDPRNKLDYVPFAIVDMFGKEVGDKLCSEVKKYMKKLFDYYVKKSSKSSSHVPSSPTSSGNSSSISSVNGCGNFVNRGRMRTKQQFEKHKEVSGSSGSKSELERYLTEDIEPDSNEFDILMWWKVNEPRFPILAEMVRDVLAIPISSVASECAFSTGGRVLDPFRSSLTPKLVQSLICVQDWLRSEPFPINIEEDLEYLEQLELDFACSGTESSIIDI